MVDMSIDAIPSRTFRGLFDTLSEDWRYIRIIIGALILWFICSQIVYIFVDNSTNATTLKAGRFAVKSMVRIFCFLCLFAGLRFYQFNKEHGGQGSMFPALSRVYKANPYQPARWLILAILATLCFTGMLSTFMSIKTAIPEMNPYYLDEAAYKMDRVIFFGHDPWTLLKPLYKIPRIVTSIDYFYTTWSTLLVGTWFYCFTSQKMDIVRRYQYCLAIILLWFFGGNILATFLSSAGPVYYEYFTGDGAAYGALMGELHAIHESHHLSAVTYHSMLLDMYENNAWRVGGISAIPSIHCGTSLLLLFTFWKAPIPRALMIAFTITIFIGSVLLAWHYAVDGLLAIPLAFAAWYGAGWIIRKLVPSSKTVN